MWTQDSSFGGHSILPLIGEILRKFVMQMTISSFVRRHTQIYWRNWDSTCIHYPFSHSVVHSNNEWKTREWLRLNDNTSKCEMWLVRMEWDGASSASYLAVIFTRLALGLHRYVHAVRSDLQSNGVCCVRITYGCCDNVGRVYQANV